MASLSTALAIRTRRTFQGISGCRVHIRTASAPTSPGAPMQDGRSDLVLGSRRVMWVHGGDPSVIGAGVLPHRPGDGVATVAPPRRISMDTGGTRCTAARARHGRIPTPAT